MRRTSGLVTLLMAVTAAAVAGVTAPPEASAAPPPCAGETGPEAGALAMAQRCDRRVEATSLRSETTQVFALPNGRLQAEVAGGPVRLRKGNGWVPVDLTLERRADGSVASKAHPFDLRLAGRVAGGTADLATLGAAGKGRMGYGWRGALPEPVLDGAKATYRDVKPGVDMVIEATRSGFEQFLVVKDRAGLREVRSVSMPLRTGGHRLRKDGDRHIALADTDGATKADGAAPVMWDAAVSPLSGEPKFPAPVGVDLVGGGADPDLVLTPDSGYLADPARTFPVTIDPGVAHTFTGALFDTMTHSGYLNTDLSGYTDLRLGYVNDAGVISKARSYLRWPTSVGGLPLGGAKIYSATLSLFEFWSFSCTSSWWYAELVGAVGTGTRYNNDSGLWSYLDTREGTNATTGYSSSCGDNWVSISVQKAVQRAADLRYGDMTIGLKGWNDAEPGHETDSKTWKKFNSSNAGSNIPKLTIEFNHLPSVSKVELNGDEACGVGVGMRRYVPSVDPTPTFKARADDVNTGQNQRLQLEIAQNGTVVQVQDHAQWIAPGQSAVMELANPLTVGTAYTYRMRTQDGVDWSPWSPTCEVQVDNPPDNPPEVSVPEDTVWAWGTPVPVTFSPAVGDRLGELYLYKYGFSADRLDMSVLAGPDGSATVPITQWSQDTSTLYVRAFNRANESEDAALTALDFWLPETPPPAAPFRVAGDGNGDGKADVAIVNDLGGGRTQLLDLTGKTGGGVYEPRVLMDNQAYPTATTRWVRGDFDGDGKTDLASFRDKGTSAVTLQVLRSNGNSLADVQVWDSTGVRNWQVARMAVLAANFDGDAAGRDDIAVISDLGNSWWRVEVFVANGSPATVFQAPIVWYENPAGWADFNRIKWVAGYFVGNDTKADIGNFYNYDSCHTRLWIHQSQPTQPDGQKFTQGVERWNSTVNNWCWGAAKYATGDMNGDGRTEIVSTYTYANCHTGVWTFTLAADATVMTAKAWESGTAATNHWCGDLVEPQMGDVNGDGKADLVAVYTCCGPYQRRVWTFTSTGAGSALDPPVLRWEGATGRPGIGSVRWTPTNRFQLVAQHSQLCLAVPNASTANAVQLVQETCNPTALHQQFVLERRGAAYAFIHPAYAPGKCIDIAGYSMDNAAAIQSFDCHSGWNQTFSLGYVRGFTAGVAQPELSDVQVTIVNVSSGKCLDVSGFSTTPGAVIHQYTYNGTDNQHFFLRPTTA